MSTSHPPREQIERRAALWVLQRDRGELDSAARLELEAWLSADSRHREAYLGMADLWRLARGLKAWRAADGEVRMGRLPGHDGPARPRARRRFSLAAACLVAVTAALFWYTQHRDTYSTPTGGYQRLVLADGSVVQLNTSTRMQVRFSSRERMVHLLSGEAHFEVARDAARPFAVLADDTMVRAIGTAFSVRLLGKDRVDVLVTEGRVAVQSQGKVSDLSAGDAARAASPGIAISPVDPADMARRLSWQAGMLQFRSEPLASVVAEFNRYNERQLQIEDPALAAVVVGGRFRTNDLESFVAAMRRMGRVRIEERGDRILLREQSP